MRGTCEEIVETPPLKFRITPNSWSIKSLGIDLNRNATVIADVTHAPNLFSLHPFIVDCHSNTINLSIFINIENNKKKNKFQFDIECRCKMNTVRLNSIGDHWEISKITPHHNRITILYYDDWGSDFVVNAYYFDGSVTVWFQRCKLYIAFFPFGFFWLFFLMFTSFP